MKMLDHGILNLPLAKRGNIDAQLDAYKIKCAAQEAAMGKAAVQARREAKADAKPILAALLAEKELIAKKAERIGCTPRELVATLTDWSKWQPAKLIKAHGEWMPSK